MRATEYERLKARLAPGETYRRRDFAPGMPNVDRHLERLVREGHLKKLRRGMYACPKTTVFGEAPPDETELLRAFLGDDRFVVFSPNTFNALGLGTTQLYNQRVVLNRKRHGQFEMGGRKYFFHFRREVPKTVSQEFILVEMLNRLRSLAEDRDQVLSRLQASLPSFDRLKLAAASRHYGTYSTKLKLQKLLPGCNVGVQ